MKDIDELMNRTPHLYAVKRFTRLEAGKYHVYTGMVQWHDISGNVIFGYNEAGMMEHVSFSCSNKKKIPSWEQMCRLKDMFFKQDEMAVQIHPRGDRYVHGVNGLGNVMHLWRPKDGDFSALNDPEAWD